MGSGPDFSAKPPGSTTAQEESQLFEAATCAATSPGGAATPKPATSSVMALPKRCPACKTRYPREFRVCPQDATPLEDSQESDPLLGAVLADSYQIVKMIGEGGMGRVYEARHTRLSRKRYAIKLLHDELTRQPDILTRFEREADAASTISHPNVVEVVDIHRLDDGRPYLVCEYLDGEDLGTLLDRVNSIPSEMALRLTVQICRALGAAHERGIVHRDMKPENVFLVGDPSAPRVKIIDFGISKHSNGSAKLTRTGMVMGTPAYMAPEQARGEAVDHRVDIYAVGAILYRATTGHKPYEGADGAMVLTQVLTEEPYRPRHHHPDISEPLELLIQRAMARDRADRHASMSELEAALTELDPTLASPDGALPSLLPPSPEGSSSREAIRQRRTQTQIAKRIQREIQGARPVLVLATILGYIWLLAALITSIADIIRWVRGPSGRLTNSEALLTTIGVLVATATPLGLWIRHLERRVWHNTAASLELARRVRLSLAIGLTAYGLLALSANLVEAVLLRMPTGHLQGPYGSLVIGLALCVGALSFWSLGKRSPKPVP